MTYFSGEWHSIPAAEWERIEAVIDAARAWRAAFYGMEPTLEVNRLAVIVLDAVRDLDEEAGQ